MTYVYGEGVIREIFYPPPPQTHASVFFYYLCFIINFNILKYPDHVLSKNIVHISHGPSFHLKDNKIRGHGIHTDLFQFINPLPPFSQKEIVVNIRH